MHPLPCLPGFYVCVYIYLCLCVPEYLYIVREKSQAAFPYVHLMFQLQASSATCRTRFLDVSSTEQVLLAPTAHLPPIFVGGGTCHRVYCESPASSEKKRKTAFQSNPNKHLITSRYRVRDGTFRGSGYKVAPSFSSEEEIM